MGKQSVAAAEMKKIARKIERLEQQLDNARFLDGISTDEVCRMTLVLYKVLSAGAAARQFRDDAQTAADEVQGDLEAREAAEARHAAMMAG